MNIVLDKTGLVENRYREKFKKKNKKEFNQILESIRNRIIELESLRKIIKRTIINYKKKQKIKGNYKSNMK